MPRIHQRVHAERGVPGGRRVELEFHDDGERVPAILLLPGATPAAAGLLLHGYGSRKEHMADAIGRALLAHGIASLSIDLPLHGERESAVARGSARQPLELLRQWKLGIREAHLALRYLEARAEVDRARLGLVGYSLGAYLGMAVAAEDHAVRALVLAAGGDLPEHTPLAALVRRVVNPARSARRYAGRPLLMVHGRRDQTIRPSQARALFEAAGEPKEIRWWDAGHILPAAAIDEAAQWLEERLRAETPGRAQRGRA